jgi:uncharacterized surface protein with fasciclin (FAS1) repeats
MNGRQVATVALGLLLGLASTSPASDLKSIAENVAAHPDMTIFCTAARETRSLESWNATGPFTLLAPTDAAFRKLSEKQIQHIVANPDLLKKLVTTHLVTGKAIPSTEFKKWDGKELNGFRISTANQLRIGQAEIILPDIKCSNGVIHGIDTVLLPGQ